MASPASPGQGKHRAGLALALVSSLRLLVWLTLSSGIIIFNKWLLSPQNFPYPVTLAFWHVLFCSLVGVLAVHSSCVKRQDVTWKTCFNICLPVAALGAAGLTLGNAAFIYLTVAFAQMLKANMPVIMFTVGCLFHTHKFSWQTCGIMVVIGAGVAASSLGELQFSGLGAFFMLSAMLAEAFKMVLLQTMMQQTDLQINPVSALYYVMPGSTLCLLPFVLLLEAGDVYYALPSIVPQMPALIASAVAACMLNLIAFWVISNTSALTMKLAGIVKDAALIVMSGLIFNTQLTPLGLGGYAVALTGIGFHNYQSLRQAQAPVDNADAEALLLHRIDSRTSLSPHKSVTA
ncbi:hypothetical protein ABBQ38_012228 [Trebouxia sp. C0009 RCD-2024]